MRTPADWRLSSVKLTVTYQENQELLAAPMAGGQADVAMVRD